MNLYVDCTDTYLSKANTGIQRVVRKIIHHPATKYGIEITPVRFDGFGLLAVNPKKLEPRRFKLFISITNLLLKTRYYRQAKIVFHLYLKLKPFMLLPFNLPRYLNLHESDIFLSADFIRLDSYVRKLREYSAKKIKIYQIAHDILPLTCPEHFNDCDVEKFKFISKQWSTYSTKIFAISKKVSTEIKHELKLDNIDYFYLGSDFKKQTCMSDVPVTTFFPRDSYFLSVGTIEPRKNHLHILQTFQKLWDVGYTDKLIFIGRMGWKCEAIYKNIKDVKTRHSKNFIWLDNANDATLEAHYDNAKAVICASFDEGFGLPIIESLARNKNVICSDIEVFREIGTDYCSYFNINVEGQDSLYELIKSTSYKKDISKFKWLTWEESINSLLSKIQNTSL